MNTKLTLTIEDTVIEKAKQYAKLKKSSLSNIIESYLKVLTKTDVNETSDEIEISTFLKSMQGKIKVNNNFDYKKELAKALSEKHL